MSRIHVRNTARILLFDERGRVLLFLTNYSVAVALPARWITPGGGIDPGETPEAAARRELFEETGLAVPSVGAAVWEQDFVRQRRDGDQDTGHSTFYAVHTNAFTPASDHWMPEEFDDILEHRWWTADELDNTDSPFEPVELAQLVRQSQP